eukprot:1403616-Pyramimonas_sp.AAC.1
MALVIEDMLKWLRSGPFDSASSLKIKRHPLFPASDGAPAEEPKATWAACPGASPRGPQPRTRERFGVQQSISSSAISKP